MESGDAAGVVAAGMRGATVNGRSSGGLAEARLVAREAGGTWVAQVLSGGLRYVAAFFAARILGAVGYGTYTLALTVTGIGSVVSILGLSPGVLPFLSKARRAGEQLGIRRLLRAALLLVGAASILVWAIVFLAAPWLAHTAFAKADLAGVLRALSPMIVLGALVGVLATFLQGLLAVKERAWIEHVLVVGLTTLGLALCWTFGWGWPGVVAAMLAGPAAGIVGATALLARLSPGVLRSGRAAGPLPTTMLLAHSWPLLGSSMLIFLLMWSDVLIMGLYRDSAEVGVYGLCARLAAGALLFHESIGMVFVARLSDHFVAGNREAMRHLYHLTSRWALWPALVVAWGLVVWGRELLAVFGPGFVGGAAPLAVLALGKAIAGCSGMSGRFFAVTGKARLNLFNLLLMVTSNVALNLLWVPSHGAMGAAAATCVSLAGTKVLQIAQVGVLFRLLPWDRKSLVPIAGISALALVAFPFRHGPGGAWGWLLPLAAFAVACAALFVARGASEEEREVWRAMRGRLRGRTET